MRLASIVSALLFILSLVPYSSAAGGGPDLTVAEVIVSDHSVDEPVDFTARVENPGDAAADSSSLSFLMTPLDGGTPHLWWAPAPPIPARGHAIVTLRALYPGHEVPTGSYSLTASADAFDAVSETDESNNVNSAEFEIYPVCEQCPDLVVTEVGTTPERPAYRNGPIELFATVKNVGPVGAGPSTVKLLADDQPVIQGTVQVPALAAGESATVSMDTNADAHRLDRGDYTVQADADFFGKVREISNLNNSATKEFTVGACPEMPKNDLRSKACHIYFSPNVSPASFTYLEQSVIHGTEIRDPMYPCSNRPRTGTSWFSYSSDSWWFTPPEVRIVIDTRGSSFDTVIALYEEGEGLLPPSAPSTEWALPGSGLHGDGPFPVYCSTWGDLNFVAKPGKTYWIQIGWQPGSIGTLRFNARAFNSDWSPV